ncbi:MAG: FAD-binding oxidoreductase [Steroidobacteraceae bacterium]
MTDTFEVLIRPHGRRIRVRAGQSVLEAALDAGLNLPHSCRSGHCASCRAHLVSGTIAYPYGRPLGITEEEAGRGDVLLCQARARSDLEVEARLIARIGEVEIKTLPCRIERKVLLAPDVAQVFLRLPTVERLEFQPGQYLDVLIEDGRRRSFSIASPPHDRGPIELHVRRVAGGGFTSRLFDELAPGALLRIEGPLGQFVYRDSSAPMILVAGGTGFAPIKAILRHVLEHRIERPAHLFWGARRALDVYEEALVLEWTRRYPRFSFTAVLSEAREPAAPRRELGLVTDAMLAHYPRIEREEVYAAGPPAMIEALRAVLPRHGLDLRRLYFDSFDYAPDALARS